MLGSSASAATESQIVAGKYKLLGLLGQGGMADVFAAEDLALRRTVALKILSPKTALSPQLVARFLQEARATARLRSEHVARVLDMGTLDSGLPYIVMEHLEGQDFANYLETRGRFSIEETVSSILQACSALAEAHAMGIVHRDLKPSNLFLTQRPDGRWLVKVLDFGIAKIHEECDSKGITTTNDVFGTPAYMSPEQIRSAKAVDARSDIWSLGLILAECITGKPVYDAATKYGILTAIAVDPVPDLHLDRVGASPELESVIRRCLQKDVNDRYRSVAELANALLSVGGSESVLAARRTWSRRREPTEAVTVDAVTTMTIDARTKYALRGVRRRAAWIAAAGLLVAIVTPFVLKNSRSEAASYPRATYSAEPPVVRQAGGPGSAPGPEANGFSEARSDSQDRPDIDTRAMAETPVYASTPNASGNPSSDPHAGPRAAGVGSRARGAGESRPGRLPTRSAQSGLEDRK